jgi:hypothetical protein
LQVKGVTLSMEPFEFLCSLVKLDLRSLGLSDLLLKLLRLFGDFDSKFLNIEVQFLDFGLISTSVLLKCEIILLLLSGGKGPLFKLLLVPVHLKFELIHLLVCFEDHILDVVQAVLLVCHPLLELLNFVLETAALPFGDLLQVLLRFDLLVFNIYETLGVYELHLHRLQMLVKDFQPLLVLLYLQTELGHETHFFTNLFSSNAFR